MYSEPPYTFRPVSIPHPAVPDAQLLGTFHEWGTGDVAHLTETGKLIPLTVALVELESGQMVQVLPREVTFLDRKGPSTDMGAVTEERHGPLDYSTEDYASCAA